MITYNSTEWFDLLQNIKNKDISIETIDLNNAGIDEKGAYRLRDAIAGNHILLDVQLNDNVSAEVKREIGALLNRNKLRKSIITTNRDMANQLMKIRCIGDENAIEVLLLACKNGYLEIARWLLQNIIKCDSINFKIITLDKAFKLAKSSGNHELVEYLNHFNAPLPQNITIKPNNYIIIRGWMPKVNDKEASYFKATQKGNVGHLSIEIFNGDENSIYTSHWPASNDFLVREGTNNTLKGDLIAEGGFPDFYCVLFGIDTKKMIEKFEKIKCENWSLAGPIKKKKQGSYSCSGFGYELLEEGGIFEHLLPVKENLNNPISPLDVCKLAEKAKAAEQILYPETKNFFEANLNILKDNFLDASQMLKLFETDYAYFYTCYKPKESESLYKKININIQKSATQYLFDAIKNHVNSFFSTLLENGANPFVSDAEGMNAFHYAVIYNNYDLVKMLLEKYPTLVNTEIQRKNDAKTATNILSTLSIFNNSDKTSPITPLDLAIAANNKKIEMLLKEYGGIAKAHGLEEDKKNSCAV